MQLGCPNFLILVSNCKDLKFVYFYVYLLQLVPKNTLWMHYVDWNDYIKGFENFEEQ
jgi:hypothetical protein